MVPPGVARGRDGGRFKRKLSEVNTMAVSRGQNELIGKYKKFIKKKRLLNQSIL